MGLKRKRSIDVSPSTSTSSFLSSSRASTSPCPEPQQFFNGMDIEAPITDSSFPGWSFGRRESLSSRLNSRTRKRFRDNRPDEQTIHENTFQKLFSAQRQHPNASPVLSHSPKDYQPPTFHAPTRQKSTLHSFWTLPAPPPQRIFSAAHPPGFEDELNRCEDCEKPLQNENGMDLDFMVMDISEECACGNCGKRVCDVCAVNMSVGRRCLGCAR